MSEKNADCFTDLKPDKQQELLDYIANNLTSQNINLFHLHV